MIYKYKSVTGQQLNEVVLSLWEKKGDISDSNIKGIIGRILAV